MNEPHSDSRPVPKGRGSALRPPNRFRDITSTPDLESIAEDEELLESYSRVKTEYLADQSKSIVSENNSPDIPFRYSVNPYRGCQHGCSYCYARPGHEYLGLDAGLDFESKIFVKHEAATLFRHWLSRPKYEPELVSFSGVTDCYQPAEREFRLTRQCLEVALAFGQPVGIVTKNALVLRDLDLLSALAEKRLVRVFLSVNSLDRGLARELEPRTSPPESRLNAVATLREHGVEAGVMVAPIIPGLNDSEIPSILEAAAGANAVVASPILLRLPLTVASVFEEWLHRVRPTEASRILSRIRSCRDGKMNSSDFGTRMRGTGPIADQIHQTFHIFARRFGLDQKLPPLSTDEFRVPGKETQGRLFD